MKSILTKIFTLVILLIIAGCGIDNEAESQHVKVQVEDYGVTPESENNHEALGKLFDAVKQMNKPVEVLFEPDAIYRIGLKNGDEPKDTKHALVVEGIDSLIINGQNATFLITNPEIGAFLTENCDHLVVKNVRVDYDIVPFTQGVITKVNKKEYWFELKLDEDYPTPDQPQFENSKGRNANWGLTIRDMDNGRRSYGPTAVFSDKWEKTADNVWRFYPKKDWAGYKDVITSSRLKPGDPFVHMARNWATTFAAINCDDVLWENNIVYSGPNVTFYPHMTSNHIIRNCHVKPKKGRIFSVNGDGIHMRSSRGNVLIEDCTFRGMADDGINLHSSALSIQKQPAQNQVIVGKHTFSVRPGDSLVLVRPSLGEIVTHAKVKEVKEELTSWLITLEEDLPEVHSGEGFESSDNFYNLSEMASPFLIRNCEFHDYRGRGVLISTQHGVIENNKFYVNEGWGVVFHYETSYWAEGPIAEDIIIRNNDFYAYETLVQGGIYAHISTHSGEPAKHRLFNNIKIENNKFYDYSGPIINMHDTRDVAIINNEVITTDKSPVTRQAYSSIILKNCEDITIDSLSIKNPQKELKAIVEIDENCMQGENISVKNVSLDVSENCKPVLDKRIK
ncbi:MAG: right-handed parallel beta-helix repeat-containing protein [Bacteroidota bacterium]